MKVSVVWSLLTIIVFTADAASEETDHQTRGEEGGGRTRTSQSSRCSVFKSLPGFPAKACSTVMGRGLWVLIRNSLHPQVQCPSPLRNLYPPLLAQVAKTTPRTPEKRTADLETKQQGGSLPLVSQSQRDCQLCLQGHPQSPAILQNAAAAPVLMRDRDHLARAREVLSEWHMLPSQSRVRRLGSWGVTNAVQRTASPDTYNEKSTPPPFPFANQLSLVNAPTQIRHK